MENENKNGSKPATEAQVALALQLYKECDYARKYSEAELRKLSCEDLSLHIAKVKDFKNAQSQNALEQARVNGFDKIGFGMVYKLFVSEADRQYFVHRCVLVGINEALYEQYLAYKEAADYCKTKVAEGGHK
jgi:hypothetical protein